MVCSLYSWCVVKRSKILSVIFVSVSSCVDENVITVYNEYTQVCVLVCVSCGNLVIQSNGHVAKKTLPSIVDSISVRRELVFRRITWIWCYQMSVSLSLCQWVSWKRSEFIREEKGGRHRMMQTHRRTEAVEVGREWWWGEDKLCLLLRVSVSVSVRWLLLLWCWGVVVVGCLVLLSHEDNILWLRELTDKDYRQRLENQTERMK